MSGALLLVGPDDAVPPSVEDGTYVVLTLHPLARLLPTAWLDHIRNRLPHAYEAWLEALFEEPPRDWPTVKAFWARHHYDDLVGRWESVAGREHLRVKVVDPEPASRRRLTVTEAELVRRINVVFHRREWPIQRYRQVIRRGVIEALEQRPADSDDLPVTTPAWAIERANAVAAADADRLAAIGIEIDGDLAVLSQVTADPAANTVARSGLPLDAAAHALTAAIDAVAATWPG
jgi:hypothetical protein